MSEALRAWAGWSGLVAVLLLVAGLDVMAGRADPMDAPWSADSTVAGVGEPSQVALLRDPGVAQWLPPRESTGVEPRARIWVAGFARSVAMLPRSAPADMDRRRHSSSRLTRGPPISAT